MKTLLLIFSIFLLHADIIKSQITNDYPFKTYLDSANNLYAVGYIQNGNQKDIRIQKFSSVGNPLIDRFLENISGDDRGIDMAVDNQNNIYLTGYFFNSQTNSNDIITIALDPNGNTRWQKILNNPGDDKGVGIDITLAQNGFASEVFITGYITSQYAGKDFIVKKFNALNGDSIWQKTYSAGRYDDIATDILLDLGHAYVIGYSYQGAQRLNDIMFQSYDITNGYLEETLLDNRPGSDEKPTAFVIADKSTNAYQKSRISLTSVSETFNVGIQRRFLTMFLDPSTQNNFEIKWFKYFSGCSYCRTDVATSISTDISGDIYVSGFVYNYENQFQSNGLDFATIKYKWNNGEYGWPGAARLFNFNDYSTTGVNDMASSIKINSNKDVYVAGPSEASNYGFCYTKYSQQGGTPILEFAKSFVPQFVEDNITGRQLNKWATLHLANDGTPLLVAMGWDQNNSYWSAVKYDENGNVQYTINESRDNTINEKEQSASTESEPEKIKIALSNYPNPFNPVTKIRYAVPHDAGSGIQNVTVKVYDLTGKEIITLVNEIKPAGEYEVEFNGSDLSSGIYYYSLNTGSHKVTQRMMMIK